MKPSAILAFTLLLTACDVARPVLESDNTKVEVKTVVKTVTDTAYIELTVIVEKVATLDTASVLENKYAKSAAPKIFFRYYYVNSSTGEKSGTMLAEVKWAAAAAGGSEP